MSTQSANYDFTSPRTDDDGLLSQIAAVLGQSSVQASVPEAPMPDIGQILLQLSEAVTQAKNEAENERRLRVALERENEAIRSKRMVVTMNDPVPALFTPDVCVSPSASLTLSECLSIVSAYPNSQSVYMSYFNSGMAEIDMSAVDRIYKPCDFNNLMFVIFSSFSAVVPAGLIPYTIEGLHSLIASTASTPIVNTSYEESSDEPPRMNLLEALNVQSDEDCSRIVTVRKCHKLGFKSHIHLRQYFSKFGRVDRVVLLPMRAKPKHALDGRGNRPSSMGFVVMESQEGADRVLSFNNYCGLHEIKGWPIEVRNFVKPADKPSMDRDVSGASTGISSDYTW